MEHTKVTERDEKGGGMEFEQFPGRSDIQVSRVLTTPKGDEIRAIVTSGGGIMLTSVGRRSSDTVILTGDVFDPGPSGTVMAKSLWDTLIEIGGEIIKDIIKGDKGGGGGGGGGCTSTTTLESDAKTGKTTVVIKVTCGPT